VYEDLEIKISYLREIFPEKFFGGKFDAEWENSRRRFLELDELVRFNKKSRLQETMADSCNGERG